MLRWVLLLLCGIYAQANAAGAGVSEFPNPTRGVIQSCKGWRLNSLPEVKRFLQEPGNADRYDNLEVKYIQGLSPELKLYDHEDLLMAKIDLARKSTAQIHELLKSHGFKYNEVAEDTDEDLDDFKVSEEL